MLQSTTIGSYPKIAEELPGPNVRNQLNRLESGKAEIRSVEQAFRATIARSVAEQEEAGIDLLTDGQIRWEDLLTPLCRDAAGMHPGGLLRWYNNNTYYRHPVIEGRLWYWGGSSLAATWRETAALTDHPLKAVLPGPITFWKMSENRHYREDTTLLSDLCDLLSLEAEALQEAGATEIQWDEPSLVYHSSAALLELGRTAMQRVVANLHVRTHLALYFGASTPWLAQLATYPVDVLLLDAVDDPALIETLQTDALPKPFGLGSLNARDVRLETTEMLTRMWEGIARKQGERFSFVHPSCGLEYLPHRFAQAKLQRLGAAVQEWNGKVLPA